MLVYLSTECSSEQLQKAFPCRSLVSSDCAFISFVFYCGIDAFIEHDKAVVKEFGCKNAEHRRDRHSVLVESDGIRKHLASLVGIV